MFSEFEVNKDLKQCDAVDPLLFNVVLEIAIRRSKLETRGVIFDKCSLIMLSADLMMWLFWQEDYKMERSVYITGRTNK